MEKIVFKKWEHLANSFIIATIIGGPITYFLETDYAKRFKIWIKIYFTPTAKKLLKEALENDLVRETFKEFNKEVLDKAIRDIPNIDGKIKELIITTKDNGLKKVIKKLSDSGS